MFINLFKKIKINKNYYLQYVTLTINNGTNYIKLNKIINVYKF